jgi:hypothetical protein
MRVQNQTIAGKKSLQRKVVPMRNPNLFSWCRQTIYQPVYRAGRLLIVFAMTLFAGLSAYIQPAHAASWHLVETIEDACSVQVLVKVPYQNSSYIDPTDVLLDRTGVFQSLIQPQGPILGVIANPSTGWSSWTPRISPIPKNSDGYVRWYCGTTAERLRCADSGADAVSFRIGPNRLLQTHCWKYY